jgi:ribosomal protein S18 acetylase RimI-like enzyme
MPHPLADLGPLLANIRAYLLGYGAEDRSDGDLVLFRSGMPVGALNGVLRMPPGELAGPLREAARRLAGVPWEILAGPDSDPGLSAALLAAGAGELEPSPVMAIRPDAAVLGPGPGVRPEPAGLEIAELAAGDGAGLAEWVGCYGPLFGVPAGQLAAQLRLEQARPDPPGALVRYTGRVGGTLAGTAALLDGHGVAGIYMVTVRPEFRRRGIGTALTAAALATAADRGLPVAVLYATPDGEPVYRRMGFAEVGRYRFFTPPPYPAA